MHASAVNGDNDIFTRERLLTIVLALATLLGLYVCYLIAKPFIAPMAFALAVAVATQRPYEWIEARIPNRTASATVAVVLITLVIIGPAAGLVTYLVQQAAENAGELQAGSTTSEWRKAAAQNPQIGPVIEWLESRVNLEAQLRQLASTLGSKAAGFLRESLHVLTQLVIMLFVLFFLYRDRDEARHSVSRLVPLSTHEANRLFKRVADTIKATVNGSLTVGFVQAVMAGLMYWILGVPGFAIWGAATFIAALIPVFGTFLIWGPVTVYLLLSGSYVKAMILVAWGMVAIGTIDNILYPYLVGDRLRLHTVPTFFSILGGITLLGPAGLILGPLALAISIALLDVWWLRTEGGRAAEQAIRKEPETVEAPATSFQDHGGPDPKDNPSLINVFKKP